MAQNQNVQVKATITVDDNGVQQYNETLKKTEELSEKAFNPKKALREATIELQKAQAEFGEYSKEAIQAAKRVADLRDNIQSAREVSDLFDPGKKFAAYSNALQSVASAYAGVQGAIGLLGVESENVEKQLLKVQSALALAEGLSTVGDIGKNFKELSVVIRGQVVGAFNALKAAIGSTGIGLLVIALGAIVANWDKIKTAVSGVSKEQEKLNEESEKNVKATKEKLDDLNSQEDILKSQGKSEKEILQLKVAQTDQIIAATEEQIKQNEITLKAQIEAEKRNKAILKGILEFIVAPSQLVINLLSQAAKLLGKEFDFDVAEFASSFVFDADKVEKEGQAAFKEQEKQLKELQNSRARYNNQIANIDKQATEKAASDAKAAREKELAAFEQIQKIRQNIQLAAIKNESDRKRKELEIQLNDEIRNVEKTEGLKASVRLQLIAALRDKFKQDVDKLDESDREKAIETEKEFVDQLTKIRTETELANIKDAKLKALEGIRISYADQLTAIDENEKFTAEQKLALKLALQEKEKQELDAKQLEFDAADAEKELAKLEKLSADQNMDFESRRSALEAQQQLLEEYRQKGLITDEQYTLKTNENSEKRKKIDDAETESKRANAEKISGLLGNLSNLFGKQTAAGKVAAIAQATIDTYLSATKAYQSMAGIPIVGPGLGVAAAAAAIFAGIKNVKEIMKVPAPAVAGGGGIAVPSQQMSSAPIAPLAPQAMTTQLDQQSINQLNNVTTRAYVVESDVSNSQERISRINRAARFG